MYRNEKSVVVEYEGAEFMVVGDWCCEEPATDWNPGEPAGFDDHQILFGKDSEGDDYDIWEVLSTKAQNDILVMANEEVKDNLNGRAEMEADKECDRRRGK